MPITDSCDYIISWATFQFSRLITYFSVRRAKYKYLYPNCHVIYIKQRQRVLLMGITIYGHNNMHVNNSFFTVFFLGTIFCFFFLFLLFAALYYFVHIFTTFYSFLNENLKSTSLTSTTPVLVNICLKYILLKKF